MTLFTDQLQRPVYLPSPPQRIVSLVPSQTELLAYLGLEKEVAGITRFCIHPQKWKNEKTKVGGTKNLHTDKIRELKPDLILANKEENDKDQLEVLMQEFPVWISDIYTLEDALSMIRSVGLICGRADKALMLQSEIKKRFRKLNAEDLKPKIAAGQSKVKAAYFIWKDPWMAAGSHTFIDDMMQRCGFQNIFGDMSRYPVIAIDQLAERNCELILLSSEPYPFKEKHAKMLQKIFPQTDILPVDSEMFSWYGSRLLQAPAYFQSLVIR